MKTMNRCLPLPLVRWLTLLVMLWASSLSPASAQTMRQFPPAAKRGTLLVTAPPEVVLNGAAARLSPGARIKDVNNGLLMSGALVGQTVLVNYVRDGQGQISEVWLLGAEEARAERSGLEVVTNFIFGSDANTAKTDDGKTPFNQLPKYPQR